MAVTVEEMADTLVRRAQARLDGFAQRAKVLTAEVETWAREGHARGDFKAAWLIGSLATGTWGQGSDVDVVVEGLTIPEGQAWMALGDRLGCDVDLLCLEDLGPGFRERVLREGRRLA